MFVLFGTVFVASLLGSLHCVGMCGPFALLASAPGTDARTQTKALVSTAAYSLGRLVTYAIVGAVFGMLGMVLNQGTSFAPWQQTATYVAGGLMIVVGVVTLARQFGWRVKLPSVAGQLSHLLQKQFQKITKQPPIRKAFLIGAATCLMPCGWLYTFAIVAAGTGSPLMGSVVMAVFWAGTVPVMVALVAGFNKLGSSIQRQIPATMATLVILVGVFTIVYRAPVAIGNTQEVVGGPENLIQQINDVNQEELPCCSKE